MQIYECTYADKHHVLLKISSGYVNCIKIFLWFR